MTSPTRGSNSLFYVSCPQAITQSAAPCALLSGRVQIWQPHAHTLRAGLDAIVLAAACPAKTGQKVLDMGCGTGAAGLCVSARVEGAHVFGVEIDPDLALLATCGHTQKKAHIGVVCADIRHFAVSTLFDHVLCNPPFYALGAHTRPLAPQRAKAIGAGQGDATLDDWVRAAARFVRSAGSLTLIHRADALPEIIAALSGRFGAMHILPLWPKEDRSAKRLIIVATKGAKGPMRLHPGIILHEYNGAWTPAARALLEEAKPINWT